MEKVYVLTKQLDNCVYDYDYKVNLSFANIFAVFERCALVLLFFINYDQALPNF